MKKGIGILIILLLISGCSNKDVIKYNYSYKGENELWTATYNVNGTQTFTEKDGTLKYENSGNDVLTVTYKNDLSQLSSVKRLEISYESSASAGSNSMDYSNRSIDQKTFIFKSSSGNGAIENKDEEIKVTINVDGEIQTFNLKPVE